MRGCCSHGSNNKLRLVVDFICRAYVLLIHKIVPLMAPLLWYLRSLQCTLNGSSEFSLYGNFNPIHFSTITNNAIRTEVLVVIG